jgi:hypothetical protein
MPHAQSTTTHHSRARLLARARQASLLHFRRIPLLLLLRLLLSRPLMGRRPLHALLLAQGSVLRRLGPRAVRLRKAGV